MHAEATLQKSAKLPQFLQDLFKYIDKVDFEGLKHFFSDDFRLYFAHYTLHGIDQGIGFVGAFDKRLPKYEHVMKDIYVGEHVTYFDGVLRVWLDDGSVVETPPFGTRSRSIPTLARSPRCTPCSASQQCPRSTGRI